MRYRHVCVCVCVCVCVYILDIVMQVNALRFPLFFNTRIESMNAYAT